MAGKSERLEITTVIDLFAILVENLGRKLVGVHLAWISAEETKLHWGYLPSLFLAMVDDVIVGLPLSSSWMFEVCVVRLELSDAICIAGEKTPWATTCC